MINIDNLRKVLVDVLKFIKHSRGDVYIKEYSTFDSVIKVDF